MLTLKPPKDKCLLSMSLLSFQKAFFPWPGCIDSLSFVLKGAAGCRPTRAPDLSGKMWAEALTPLSLRCLVKSQMVGVHDLRILKGGATKRHQVT